MGDQMFLGKGVGTRLHVARVEGRGLLAHGFCSLNIPKP